MGHFDPEFLGEKSIADDNGYWILKILEIGYWNLDIGYWILDIGY